MIMGCMKKIGLIRFGWQLNPSVVFTMAMLGLVMLLLFITCGKDPASSPTPTPSLTDTTDNIPQKVEMSFRILSANESITAYCHYPITAEVEVANAHELRYVDSMFVVVMPGRISSPISMYNIPKADSISVYECKFSVADTGIHKVALRIYETRDKGKYRDVEATIRTAIDFSGTPVDVEMEDDSMRVVLSGKGSKYDGVDWYWDLSSLNLGTIRAAGDTSIVVNKEYNNTILLSQIYDGSMTVAVRVPFVTKFHENSFVPLILSRRTDNTIYNGYIFQPISLTAEPRQADRVFIDSIVLWPSGNMTDSPLVLNSANGYTVSFSFADTGSFVSRLRVYNRFGNTDYRDTLFTVRVGADFGALAIDALVGKKGMRVPLAATGSKYEGVKWRWNLTSLGLGVIESLGDTSVVVDTGLNGVILLSQTLNGSTSNYSISVPFVTKLHTLSNVPFTVSAIENGLNALCFFPVTIAASPLQVDKAFIDSITVFKTGEAMPNPVMRLTAANNYSSAVDFADTGVHNYTIRVYDGTAAAGTLTYRDTAIALKIGMDFGADTMNYLVCDTGGVVTLRATGKKADGVAWAWDLSNISLDSLRSSNSDTMLVLAKRADYSTTVSLYQLKRDTVAGVARERKSPRRTFDFKTDTASYKIKIVFPNGEKTHIFRASGTMGSGNGIWMNINPIEEILLKSGVTAVLSYVIKNEYTAVGGDKYYLSCDSRIPLRRVDSVYIGKELVSTSVLNGSSTLDLGRIREDVDVRFYSSPILLRSGILFPSKEMISSGGFILNEVDMLISPLSGLAIYTLNKNITRGKIIYGGVAGNSDEGQFVDTFNLSGKLLMEGGHEVWYDSREYGRLFDDSVIGNKWVRFEFEDGYEKEVVSISSFGIAYPHRQGGGGQGGSWQMSDEYYLTSYVGNYVRNLWDGISIVISGMYVVISDYKHCFQHGIVILVCLRQGVT